MIDSLELIIWERKLTIPIEYDCYKGESITDAQIADLENFISHMDRIEKAKKPVEDYCRKSVMEDDENHKKDNIFSYVKPECIFVKRDTDQPRIALMCKYRYDPEHGLAIVFSSDGSIEIGAQDIIL